jgi:hypothetical protein
MTKFLAAIAIIAIDWVLTAWFLMIAIGVVHAIWLPQLPTIGFSTAVLLALLIELRGGISGLGKGLIEGLFGGGR